MSSTRPMMTQLCEETSTERTTDTLAVRLLEHETGLDTDHPFPDAL